MTPEKQITCPKCGHADPTHEAAYRHAPNIIDCGWRCVKCRHEWGFELLRDPETREEWQQAADAAAGALALDSARKYGFITGGPTVNCDRCEEILRHAAAMGITPANDAPQQFVEVLLHAERARRA